MTTRLGHTNGSGLVLENLDGSNVSFKVFDDQLHREYTGHPAAPLFENFRRSYEAGLEMKASTVFNPDFGGLDQVEKVAAFVGGLDRSIPFHVLGYIPVPDAPWRRPTDEEMAASSWHCPALPRYGDVLPFHVRAGQGLGTTGRPICGATSSLT